MKNNVILLFLVLSALGQAQIKKDSELLFDQIFPVALTVSVQNDIFDNQKNEAITYSYDRAKSLALGFDYNFFQTGRFNFRTGFHIKNVTLNTQIRIPGNELTIDNNLEVIFTDSPNWTFSVPVSVEYIRRITPDIYVSAIVGYEFQHYGFTRGQETFDSLVIEDTPIIETTFEEYPRAILGGFHIGLGAYLRLDHEVFLKLDFMYQTRNNDRWNETITAQNLQISPNATSNHQWTGGYTAITARFAPPMRWFFKSYRAKSTKFL